MGRHRKTIIEELQVLTWYYFVRSKCDLDNKALSRRFCGLTESQIEFGEKNVPKIFERIQTKAQIPSSGNHHYRNYDLIKRVEADDQFHGTEKVYVSSFWQLLKEHPFTLASTARLTQNALKDCGAIRLDRAQQLAIDVSFLSEKFEGHAKSKNPIPEDMVRRYFPVVSIINLSKVHPYSLDVIGLAGALFRESFLTSNLEDAILFKKEYERLLSEYASQEWMKPIAEDFVEHATEKLTLDYEFTDEEGNAFDCIGNLILLMNDAELNALSSIVQDNMQQIRESLVKDYDPGQSQ